MVVMNAETRSSKRASLVIQRVLGFQVSTNTIVRLCGEVGEELAAAEQDDWRTVLTGEVPVPGVAIVEYDGARNATQCRHAMQTL